MSKEIVTGESNSPIEHGGFDMKLKYPILKVVWIDAAEHKTGWYDIGDVKEWGKNEEFYVNHVGYLIYEDKDYIVLSSMVTPFELEVDTLLSNSLKIPKTVIVGRHELKV